MSSKIRLTARVVYSAPLETNEIGDMMQVLKYSQDGESYHLNEFVVVFEDDTDTQGCGHYAKVLNEQEIGHHLEMAHYASELIPFRIYDLDTEGKLSEVEIRHMPWKFNSDLYADVADPIVQPDTGELVGHAFYRIDGRA